MRAVGFGLLGLVLGAAAGFWLGLMGGLIYAEAAQAELHRGLLQRRRRDLGGVLRVRRRDRRRGDRYAAGLAPASGDQAGGRKVSAGNATRSSV
jgi:hypothetical protein